MTAHAIVTKTGSIASGNRSTPSPLSTWLNDVRAKLNSWWTWHQAYRNTVRELSRLSNRELADIGIERHDIPRLALEHAEMIQNAAKAR